MNGYIEMVCKTSGHTVRMYDIVVINGQTYGVCFDYGNYKNSSRGWVNIKMNSLVPPDMPLDYKKTYTKSDKNRIKSRLHLETATWKATDGTLFDHKDLELAIEYERKLEEKEKEAME